MASFSKWSELEDTFGCLLVLKQNMAQLRLSGHKRYLHVDSHSVMDLEWGSWLMRQRAQTQEYLGALTPLLVPQTLKRGLCSLAQGAWTHSWALLPKAVSQHAKD